MCTIVQKDVLPCVMKETRDEGEKYFLNLKFTVRTDQTMDS